MKLSWVLLSFLFAFSAADELDQLASHVVSAYIEGTRNARIPELLAYQVPTRDLVHDISQSTARVLKNVLKEFHRQAYVAMNADVSSIQLKTRFMLDKLNSMPLTRSYYLDDELIAINLLMAELSRSQPQLLFNQTNIRPAEKLEIQTYGNSEASVGSIYMDLPNLVVRNMRPIVDIFGNIFYSGLEKAVPAITAYNNQLKIEYLRGKLVPVFQAQISSINNRCTEIMPHVAPKTWETYSMLSQNLTEASWSGKLALKACNFAFYYNNRESYE